MAYIQGVHNKLVRSNSSGSFSDSSATLVQVTDGTNPLQAVITTHGGRVKVSLEDDGSNTGSQLQGGEGGISNDMIVVFKRNGTAIANMQAHHQNNVTISELGIPLSSYSYVDTPPAGTWTYTVFVQGVASSSPQNIFVSHAVLQAEEQ